VRNHAFADAVASEALGFGATENAEDIVLGAGEAMRLEELLGFEAEAVGGLLKGDEDTGLDGKSWMGNGAATHGATIVVMTTNVKRKELRGGGEIVRKGRGEKARPSARLGKRGHSMLCPYKIFAG
jgi:hypothetical protein